MRYLTIRNLDGTAVKLDTNKKLQVYRNLHKNCYSVQQSGKVVAHVDSITLCFADFLVANAGRSKVLKTGKKNVHARVSGYLRHPLSSDRLISESNKSGIAKYNPFKFDSFVDASNESGLKSADVVELTAYDNTMRALIKYHC
ncbi:MAG: hypothetical protein CML44_04845 [Rhodobacteraceae bacterium]|nr:hypothetical protein [Paracoccaceae bacterium]|tara:strand:+ start:10434 stop:10862 length:429 start_codon:yes stop_codon:yes gene_type:complete